MPQINYLEVLKASFTLVILLFCSVMSLGFALERWIFFLRNQVDADALMKTIRKALESGQVEEARKACMKNEAPVSRLLLYGIDNRRLPREDLTELMASKRLEERLRMEHYLGLLGTMGNIAPFIGLFGTVIGIIKAFRDLALSGTGGPTVVAKGIAEALVATAGGLAVAIPAVIFFNYFMRRVKQTSVEMEVYSMRLLVLLEAK